MMLHTIRLFALALGAVLLLPSAADAMVTTFDKETCRNKSTPPRMRAKVCELVLNSPNITDKNRFAFVFARATAYRALKRYGDAMADFTLALTLKPKSAEAFYHRGWLHFRAGRLDAALQDLDAAVFHRPEYFQALMSRAHLKRKQRNYRAAISDFSLALELKPGHSNGFAARGSAYFQVGRLDRAEKDFARAIRLNRKNHEALAKRGALYAVNGNFDAALADYDRAIKLNPAKTDYKLRRVRLLHSNDFHSRAMNELRQLARRSPNNAAVMVVTSSVWLSLEEGRKAAKVMKKLIRKIGVANAHIRRGRELLLQGRYRLAREDAKAAVAADAGAGTAHGLHALTLLRLQRLGKAEAAASRALDINGRNTVFLMTRAAIRWQAGDHLGSDKDIRRARRIDDHLPPARKARGLFHHEMVRALLRLNGYDAGSRTPFADGRYLIALNDFQEANDLPVSKTVTRRALRILQDHKI